MYTKQDTCVRVSIHGSSRTLKKAGCTKVFFFSKCTDILVFFVVGMDEGNKRGETHLWRYRFQTFLWILHDCHKKKAQQTHVQTSAV